MDEDVSGFRAVLHEWARRQLTERSWHAGPFEVTAVHLTHKDAIEWSEMTREDALTDVLIEFRHDPVLCRQPAYLGSGPCRDTSWSPMDSQNTVTMLNELLAIAADEPVSRETAG